MTDHADTGPFAWIWDDDGMGQFLEAIHSAQEVVWDTETTGLVPYAIEGGIHNGGVGARQALATFTLPQANADGLWDGEDPTTWILPLSHPDSPWSGNWKAVSRSVANYLLELGKPLTGHNVKFDLKYQALTAGVNMARLVNWDTADASRILEQGLSAKLADCCGRAFDVPSWKDFDFSQPGEAERLPLFELGEYGGRDTYWTWRLKRWQQGRMFLLPEHDDEPMTSEEIIDARSGRLAVLIGMPTVAGLSQLEINGIYLDEDYTRQELEISTKVATEKLDEMAHLYEEDWAAGKVDLVPEQVSTAPTSLWFRRFMDYAVEQGDAMITNLTPTGKPQWSKSVLNKQRLMKGDDSVPALVLDQRHHAKRKEFLDSWMYHATTIGKVFSNYSTGMATGRLSSSGPNMQQITKTLRPCFVPSPGYVLADFDFSQIELRVAAIVANCIPMKEAFRRGDDLHSLLAADVMGVDPSEIGKGSAERQMAKAVNFGLLFGLGVFGLKGYAEDSYNVTMSQDQAQEFYNAYFRKWEGLKEWHAAVESRLLRDNLVISPLGRVRNFHGYGGRDSLNAAINAPVQGMASDLMQLAIADIQGLVPDYIGGRGEVAGVRIVGTVHDSAVVELPEDDWHAKALEVKERMEQLNPLLKYIGVELDVPIVVEATVGTRWSLKDVGEI